MTLFIWIMIGMFGTIAVCWIVPRLVQDESTRLFDEFMTNAYRRGITPQQAFVEHRFRTALAKVRRLASEDVMRGPHELSPWRRHLAAEAENIARDNPQEGVLFVQWTSQLGFHDFLYPPAAKVYWKALRSEPVASKGLDEDQIAALRVR